MHDKPEAMRARHKKWEQRHPDRVKLQCRRSALKQAGWTMETYEAAVQEQRGICAVCKQPPKPKKSTSGGLVPDHIHTKPPQPRGLLCHNCNAALGLLKDNPEVCEQAAAYLRSFQIPGQTIEPILEAE